MEQAQKAVHLALGHGVAAAVGHREVGVDAFAIESGERVDGPDGLEGRGQGNPQPSHAAIDLEMNARRHALPPGLGRESAGAVEIRQGHHDPLAHQFRHLAGQNGAENLHRQAERHQLEGLVGFGHAEARDAGRGQRAGDRQAAESVGIRLEDGHHPRRGDRLDDVAVIVAQPREVDVDPDPRE